MSHTPVITAYVQSVAKPISGTIIIRECVFSFKYFKQIDNFGLSTTNSGWFSSLLSRLSDISKFIKEDFIKDARLGENLRYHAINWNARGVKISRKDLNWVDKNIIENEEEFIFYQFHISKALGRIIGYWQENVFFIVLLDPLHNMQPSNFSDYKIRPCHAIETDLNNYIYRIDKIREIKCVDDNCKVKAALLKINPVTTEINAVICFLDDDYLEMLNEIIETKVPLTEIIQMGIIAAGLK